MAGFGALVNWSSAPRPERVELLSRGIARRGPEGVTTAVVGSAALVHARFATTPESVHERQPTRHATHDWWLVADARIDNGDDLRADLSGTVDHPLHTDADLILAAYERWGAELADHLIGDFAFALWDGPSARLVVVRDHLGVRPVFWAHDADGALVVASTLRSVVDAGGIRREPDLVFLADHASFAHQHPELTPWAGVQRLRGGHVLVADAGGQRVERYWRPTAEHRPVTVDAAASEVRRLFRQAVACRLRAVGPVAVEVSGGFDSTSVAAVAVEQVGAEALHAMALTFPGLECDESEYIDAASEHLGLSIARFDATGAPPFDFVEDVLESMDLPGLPDGQWCIPLVRSAAGANCRVVLTGQGGDHLLYGDWRVVLSSLFWAGHPWAAYRAVRRKGRSRRRSVMIIGRTAGAAWLRRHDGERSARWVSTLSKRPNRSAAESYLSPTLQALVTPEPAVNAWPDRPWGSARAARANHYDGSSAWFIELWDRDAAAGGCESRHPFMDVRLVEYVLSLGEDVVACGLDGRGLHRRMIGSLLPSRILDRTGKAEFSEPWHRAASGLAFRLEQESGPTDGDELIDRRAVRATSARIAADPAVRTDSWAWWGALSAQAWLSARW